MNKILFLLFVVAPLTARAQTPCKKLRTIPAAKRMEIYPFQKNCSVWLVSFPDYDLNAPMDVGREQALPPFAKGKLDVSRFTIHKQLSRAGTDSLTEIFYCYGKGIDNSEHGCNKTHQAILFVDGKGMIYSYICFCFDQGGYQTSSDSFDIGGWCDGKLDMIRQVFVRAGINV